LKIFVSTCDTHDHMIKPFMYLFNKFWGSDTEVTILGYRTPPYKLLENFNFVSLAKSQKTPNQWAQDHRNYFSSLKEKHFIWTVEDSFLLRPVNFAIYEKLNKKLFNDDKIGRCSYTNAPEYLNKKGKVRNCTVVEECQNFNIIQKKQDAPYRISVVWSAWKKDYCLKYLEDGWSPWDTEILGSKKAINDGSEIIATEKLHTIDYASANRKGSRGLPHGIMDFRYTNKPELTIDKESLFEMYNLKIINEHCQVIKEII